MNTPRVSWRRIKVIENTSWTELPHEHHHIYGAYVFAYWSVTFHFHILFFLKTHGARLRFNAVHTDKYVWTAMEWLDSQQQAAVNTVVMWHSRKILPFQNFFPNVFFQSCILLPKAFPKQAIFNSRKQEMLKYTNKIKPDNKLQAKLSKLYWFHQRCKCGPTQCLAILHVSSDEINAFTLVLYWFNLHKTPE